MKLKEALTRFLAGVKSLESDGLCVVDQAWQLLGELHGLLVLRLPVVQTIRVKVRCLGSSINRLLGQTETRHNRKKPVNNDEIDMLWNFVGMFESNLAKRSMLLATLPVSCCQEHPGLPFSDIWKSLFIEKKSLPLGFLGSWSWRYWHAEEIPPLKEVKVCNKWWDEEKLSVLQGAPVDNS